MKHVVSISLGSSSRNLQLKQSFERNSKSNIGTDGDKKKAIQLIEELDGKVDAFGMGGIDCICIGKKSTLKDAET